MNTIFNRNIMIIAATLLVFGALALFVNADHSWGDYHWARTVNSFTLKLGDNVSDAWDSYLATASDDWSVSSVLDTTIVPGLAKKNCSSTSGRVEVCSKKYGFNGWLGLAQIWVSGNHITQGLAKMNDTYFNTATYNTPAWRHLVICQEIAHAFGLDHQDENFYNTNLGSCMDYTVNPNGPPSNEHPNQHDYDQLETIIYAHLDSADTVGAEAPSKGNQAEVDLHDPSSWGKSLRKDSRGNNSLFVRDLGKGQKIFTFVTWAE